MHFRNTSYYNIGDIAEWKYMTNIISLKIHIFIKYIKNLHKKIKITIFILLT